MGARSSSNGHGREEGGRARWCTKVMLWEGVAAGACFEGRRPLSVHWDVQNTGARLSRLAECTLHRSAYVTYLRNHRETQRVDMPMR